MCGRAARVETDTSTTTVVVANSHMMVAWPKVVDAQMGRRMRRVSWLGHATGLTWEEGQRRKEVSPLDFWLGSLAGEWGHWWKKGRLNGDRLGNQELPFATWLQECRQSTHTEEPGMPPTFPPNGGRTSPHLVLSLALPSFHEARVT